MTKTTVSARPGVLLIVTLVGIIPAVAAISGALAQYSWVGQLPAEIITHWGPNGADGWMSPESFALLSLLITLGLVALMSAIATNMYAASADRGTVIAISVLSLILTPGMTLGMTMSVYMQRVPPEGQSLSTAAISWTLALIAVVYLVIASILIARAPRLPVPTPDATAAQSPMVIEPDTRVSWFSHAVMPLWTRLLLIIILGLSGGFSAWALWGVGQGWAVLVTVVLTLVLIGVVWSMLVWNVRVDEAGLEVRGAAGFPRYRYALAEIAGVRVSDVQALRDFGGWGVRVGSGGKLGIVTDSGPALEIDRRDRGPFVVTARDAETGAEVLAALLQQRPSPETEDRS